jgi:hypothetical protein
MGLYRRVARSKKGMSTVFGGLFFVILILMGFNVMLWGFVQWDAYNRVIANMGQRDQAAVSENIVPINATCDSSCKAGSGTLNLIVDNLGGSSVTIDTVYLYNVNGTGGSHPCSTAPCMASPASGTGNIPAGSVNFAIQVNNLNIGGDSYHIILASSRGRLFSLYWPWRFNSLTINQNGGGNFVTNIGPLALYFDTKSFNYTTGSSGACSGVAPNGSCGAFCMPSSSVVLWIRIANTSTQQVKILTQTGMQAQAYGVNGFGQFAQAWLLDPNSVNPSTLSAYSYTTNPYVLQPAGPNGPGPTSFAILKLGAGSAGGSGSATFGNSGHTWISFIGIYYLFNGQPQGQTIPFMDFYTNYPNCVN